MIEVARKLTSQPGTFFANQLESRDIVDRVIPISTEDAKAMARRLACEEGLFAGTSSGANVCAAIELGKQLGPQACIVTLMIDSGLKLALALPSAHLGIRTADLEMKNVILASDPRVFFTTPHFDGYPAVLVRLEKIGLRKLKDVLVEAWLGRAPKRVAKEFLSRNSRMRA